MGIAAAPASRNVPWWSVSKTVIALAALALVRDGLATLDEPVDPAGFTLRHLLQHAAGLPDYCALPIYRELVASGGDAWPADTLLRLVEAGRLIAVPGSAFHYSNVGYLLVVRLLEARSGRTLGDILHEQVLAPLAIADVRLAQARADLDDVAMGEAAGYDPRLVYHGLLVGPADAAATLLQRALEHQFPRPDLAAAMLQGFVVGGPMPGRPWRKPAYGLGLMIEAADPLGPVGHTGGGPGSVIAAYARRIGDGWRAVAIHRPDDDADAAERDAFALLGA